MISLTCEHTYSVTVVWATGWCMRSGVVNQRWAFKSRCSSCYAATRVRATKTTATTSSALGREWKKVKYPFVCCQVLRGFVYLFRRCAVRKIKLHWIGYAINMHGELRNHTHTHTHNWLFINFSLFRTIWNAIICLRSYVDYPPITGRRLKFDSYSSDDHLFDIGK